MDMVLGISMGPTMARLVLVEGQNADGVIVEEDEFAVAAGKDTAIPGAADEVIAAIVGTRQGAVEGGYQLTSTGVTWTDPAEVGALRAAIASHGIDGVTLVSPLLAVTALAQTVGQTLGYERIAMLFIERDSATLAVVEVADGSIVDVHRHALVGSLVAELAAMVAGLDAGGPRADGLLVVGSGSGCGADMVAIEAALEGATGLEVTLAEEPDMALARGAALASANTPLFAASTAALAYSLDQGTGTVNPRALTPAYLDVSGNAELGARALAYSALKCDAADAGDGTRRGSFVLVGSALAGISVVVAAVVVVSLTSGARPAPSAQATPRAVAAQDGVPPPEAQLPAQSLAPPAPEAAAPPAPTPEVAAPPAPTPEAAAQPAPPAPPPAQPAPRDAVNEAPPPAPPPRRAPPRRAPQAAPPPVQQAPAPAPAAPPPEPAAAPAPPPQYPPYSPRPPRIYLRLPFIPVPIPIGPPAPPPPPPPAAPPPR